VTSTGHEVSIRGISILALQPSMIDYLVLHDRPATPGASAR
jgi:hypothetical protein